MQDRFGRTGEAGPGPTRFSPGLGVAGSAVVIAGFAEAVLGLIMWLAANCGPACTSSAGWASAPGLALTIAGLVLFVIGGAIWYLSKQPAPP